MCMFLPFAAAYVVVVHGDSGCSGGGDCRDDG